MADKFRSNKKPNSNIEVIELKKERGRKMEKPNNNNNIKWIKIYTWFRCSLSDAHKNEERKNQYIRKWVRMIRSYLIRDILRSIQNQIWIYIRGINFCILYRTHGTHRDRRNDENRFFFYLKNVEKISREEKKLKSSSNQNTSGIHFISFFRSSCFFFFGFDSLLCWFSMLCISYCLN